MRLLGVFALFGVALPLTCAVELVFLPGVLDIGVVVLLSAVEVIVPGVLELSVVTLSDAVVIVALSGVTLPDAVEVVISGELAILDKVCLRDE